MNELRAHYKLGELVSAFGVARSSYSYRCQKVRKVDHEKERLKAKVIAIHQRSRGAVGARRVSKTLKQQGLGWPPKVGLNLPVSEKDENK